MSIAIAGLYLFLLPDLRICGARAADDSFLKRRISVFKKHYMVDASYIMLVLGKRCLVVGEVGSRVCCSTWLAAREKR